MKTPCIHRARRALDHRKEVDLDHMNSLKDMTSLQRNLFLQTQQNTDEVFAFSYYNSECLFLWSALNEILLLVLKNKHLNIYNVIKLDKFKNTFFIEMLILSA